MQPSSLEKQAHATAVDIVENHPEHHLALGISGLGWLAAVQKVALAAMLVLEKLHDAGLFTPPPPPSA